MATPPAVLPGTAAAPRPPPAATGRAVRDADVDAAELFVGEGDEVLEVAALGDVARVDEDLQLVGWDAASGGQGRGSQHTCLTERRRPADDGLPALHGRMVTLQALACALRSSSGKTLWHSDITLERSSTAERDGTARQIIRICPSLARNGLESVLPVYGDYICSVRGGEDVLLC